MALRLLLFTTTRERELLTARWQDVDLASGVRTIPHTKSGKAHQMFLSRQAMEGLAKLKTLATDSSFVFPHISHLNNPMGATTLNERLRRMMGRGVKGLSDFTVHDLRRIACCELDEGGCFSH
jgi:integrase